MWEVLLHWGGVPAKARAGHQGSALMPMRPQPGRRGPAMSWTGQGPTANWCSPCMTCRSVSRAENVLESEVLMQFLLCLHLLLFYPERWLRSHGAGTAPSGSAACVLRWQSPRPLGPRQSLTGGAWSLAELGLSPVPLWTWRWGGGAAGEGMGQHAP